MQSDDVIKQDMMPREFNDDEAAALMRMWAMGGLGGDAQDQGSSPTYIVGSVGENGQVYMTPMVALPTFPMEVVEGWKKLKPGATPFEYLARNGPYYAMVTEQMIQFFLWKGEYKEAARLLNGITRLGAIAMKAMGAVALDREREAKEKRMLEHRESVRKSRAVDPKSMTDKEIEVALKDAGD